MKLRSNKKFQVERVKKGKRNYGDILTLAKNGQRIYMATRLFKDIHRCGHSSISEAMREQVAAWGIDNDTLYDMRNRGIKVVGIVVRDTGDIFLSSLDQYFDTDKAFVRNFERKGGSLQRYLPLQFFKKKDGIIKL